jgi:hypothetical protein
VSTALDVVDGEVRELIRRRGLDPFTRPAPVRVLVRDVVAHYSERSLNSALPPIGDPEFVVRDVLGVQISPCLVQWCAESSDMKSGGGDNCSVLFRTCRLMAIAGPS